MKKTFIVLICLCILVSAVAAGCGRNTNTGGDATTAAQQTTAASSAAGSGGGESNSADTGGGGSNGGAGTGNNGGDTGNNGAGNSQQTGGIAPEAITLPIVDSPITLTLFTELSDRSAASVVDYNEMLAFQEMQERTGITIEFMHATASQINEQFNLMVASGDLADLMYYDIINRYVGGPIRAISDNVIIELNDLIFNYAPNFVGLMDEYDQIYRDAITDDGILYQMPLLRVTISDRTSGGFQIRKDWLDKIGLDIPTTIDEWHTVLTAFKEQQLGGPDTIPFINNSNNNNYFQYLTSGWGIFYGYYHVDGAVKYGPYEPEYRDFLTTMRQWYTEGLIDPDFLATDRAAFDAKITTGIAGAYYGLLNSFMGTYNGIMPEIDPEFLLWQAPLPTVADGKKYNFELTAARMVNTGFYIGAKNQYPVESIKWLDYFYSDEGSLLFNFGIEGVTYNMIDGYPTYTELITNNPDGLSIDRAVAAYTPAGGSARLFQDPRYWEQMMRYENQKEALTVLGTGSSERVLPPVSITPDESARMAALQSDIDTYVDEMFARFIMGQESIDNFDSYINTLKSFNIEEGIAIQQSALDRYYQRPASFR